MINDITEELFDSIYNHIIQKKTQDKIKTNILDPTICYMLDRLYPYIIITASIFIVLLLLASTILYLVLKNNKI